MGSVKHLIKYCNITTKGGWIETIEALRVTTRILKMPQSIGTNFGVLQLFLLNVPVKFFRTFKFAKRFGVVCQKTATIDFCAGSVHGP